MAVSVLLIPFQEPVPAVSYVFMEDPPPPMISKPVPATLLVMMVPSPGVPATSGALPSCHAAFTVCPVVVGTASNCHALL